MNSNKKFMNKRFRIANSQHGFSILELLIAMIIGLFLLVGITTSYLSSKKSSITRDQFSVLEDNGRVALEIMAESLQHAGYRSNSLKLIEPPFVTSVPTNYSCGTGKNSVLVPDDFPDPVISNNDDATGTGDSIGIFYLGDDDLNIDCGGEDLPTECRVGSSVDKEAHKIYNAFFVDAYDKLQCKGSQSTNLVTIAEGVENIQILYGVNVDDDNDKTVERYVSSAVIGSDWGNVVSLQIAILVRSSIEIKDQSESQSFTLLNTQVDTPNDRFERAVFTTSIKLRNL